MSKKQITSKTQIKGQEPMQKHYSGHVPEQSIIMEKNHKGRVKFDNTGEENDTTK